MKGRAHGKGGMKKPPFGAKAPAPAMKPAAKKGK